MQVHSLTHRNLFADAVALGVELLRELGIAVPVDLSADELDHQIGHLYRWLDHTDPAKELARAEIEDPALLAATGMIAALVPALFFIPEDFALFLWLTLEAPRIWLDHGPARSLVGPTGVAANAATVKRDENYAVGYRAMRHVVALGGARGYEPDTSLVRASFAGMVCWSEPIENAVRESKRAREGLLAGGDVAWAGYTYHTTVVGLLECAPSLDDYVAEVEAGLAFVRRTGNEQTGQWLDSFRWVAGALRGEGGAGTAAAGDPIKVYSGGNSEISLARTCRADSNDNVIFCNELEVFSLTAGLWLNDFANSRQSNALKIFHTAAIAARIDAHAKHIVSGELHLLLCRVDHAPCNRRSALLRRSLRTTPTRSSGSWSTC